MNAQDFLNGIKKLNEQSSWEEITLYLFYDMKKQAVLDSKKIKNFKVLNQFGISLEYVEGEYLQNWLRYKIASKNNQYTVKFDGDTTEIVKTFLKEMLERQGVETEYEEGASNRVFTINNSIQLETDTMNSYATTFNQFIRKKIDENFVEQYKKMFSIKNASEAYRDLFFLMKIDEWKENFQQYEKIWKLFDEFAKLSHVIGNFTLVPKGYNTGRVKITKDYWDLTLLDLKEKAKGNNLDENFKWYIDNYYLFFYSQYYLKKPAEISLIENEPVLFYDNHVSKIVPNSIEEYESLLEIIIKSITLRGLEMLQAINPKLMNNTLILDYINNSK